MGLANTLFLLGLLAAAIPVVIHLTRNRRYRRTSIGSLRFLQAAIKESRRLRRVENWPLLITRLLVIAMLALLFARPFLTESENTPGPGSEIIVLLDGSGSMTGDAVENARKAAQKIVDGAPAEAIITLAQYSDSVEPLASLDAFSAREGAPTRIATAIDWTLDRLASKDESAPPARVHLVSDLQRSALPATPSRLWSASAPVEIVPIEPSGKWNGCVEKVELTTPYRAQEIEVEALIRFHGRVPGDTSTATLTLEPEGPGSGNPMKLTQNVPGTGGRVQFRWDPEDRTTFSGWVEVESEDAWPLDNRRHFTFQLREPKRVLLVDGDPGATPFESEVYFLNKALTASGAAHGQSPFRPTVKLGLTGKLGVVPLDDYHAIACCNVPVYSSEEARALAAAADNGTGLIFFLGDKSDPAGHASVQQAGLFPGNFERSVNAIPRPVQSWQRDHPALERFDGRKSGDLRRIILRDAFVLGNEPGSELWSQLIELDNGRPVLLENTTTGEAPIFVFSNPATREWNDLPRERLFVPLVRQLFGSLVRVRFVESTVYDINPGRDEARDPGLYPSQTSPGSIDLIAPAVSEMDPTPVDEDAYRAALSLPRPESGKVAAPTGVPESRERPIEWWPWIALILVGLLVVENWLADRPPPVHSDIRVQPTESP